MRGVTRGRDTMRGRLKWSDRLPLDPDVDASAYDRTHHIRVVALVFIGGCLGGVVRYVVVRHWAYPPAAFPWATLVVNVFGALAIGVVVEVATEVLRDSRLLRPFVGAGFCGALTTFSSIVVDTDRLAAHGHAGLATAYLLTTIVAGLAACAAGLFVTRAVTR